MPIVRKGGGLYVLPRDAHEAVKTLIGDDLLFKRDDIGARDLGNHNLVSVPRTFASAPPESDIERDPI